MTSKKTPLQRSNVENQVQIKKTKRNENFSYLYCCLEDSGLILKYAPEKCIAKNESVTISRNINQNLQKHFEYPRNVSELIKDLQKECQNLNVFRYYLYPNIVYKTEDSSDENMMRDSVIKILLSVPVLQTQLTNYIFEKAIELTVEDKCGSWIQIILRCFSTLDSIVSTDNLSTNLINLLDITSEKIVKLEIITAIPYLINDQQHEQIATQISRFLEEDHELIPAILSCLSYLNLSHDQYERLQNKTLNILATLTKYSYFVNFVQFLLIPGRMNESGYLESVQGLRTALGWPRSEVNCHEVITSQVLTASAMRNSMISSKLIATMWFKAMSLCKVSTEHVSFDIIILLLLYTTTETRQKQVENLMKKQIKSNILTEELLDEAFNKYSAIIKEYLQHLIQLTTTLLKSTTEPLIESFASHTCMLLFANLEDCRQFIISEILNLGLDKKQSTSKMLQILNNIASENMVMLKPQSLQLLTLLDTTYNMRLNDIRDINNLVCGLAYSFENSVIRDDINMIIRKQLSSSHPALKVKGILAGVHAVKYLMVVSDDDTTMNIPDDVSTVSITFLTEGASKEAAQIIELMSDSTKIFPDLTAFFYDELSVIISNASYINKKFLAWLTDAVTNDLQQNFIVNCVPEPIEGLRLSMQYCFNSDSEMDEVIAINIAGLTLDRKGDINIGIISSLFNLVAMLHSKQYNGDLSSIDALLGCPVVMPEYDIDVTEDMEAITISNILDCLLHCGNWFRELLNAFATQTDNLLKQKILKRVANVEEIEKNISQILYKSRIIYKSPVCTFNVSKYSNEQKDKIIKIQNVKQKSGKKPSNDDTAIPETMKSQGTSSNTTKEKLDVLQNLPFRKLNINILKLLNNDLTSESNSECELNMDMFTFLLKSINTNIDSILLSKLKRKTFLSKEDNNVYDPKKAESCAQEICDVLPKVVTHLDFITTYITNHGKDKPQEEIGFMYTTESMKYFTALEYIYKMLTIYFKWMGFRNHNKILLKTSLRTIATSNTDPSKLISLKDLLLSVAKIFQEHEKYCLQLSTALSLIELVSALQELSDSIIIVKILKAMASNFLSQQWKTLDALPEKGLLFNQGIEKLISINFLSSELISLKTLSIQIATEIQQCKSRNDTLESMKCINKGNFPILYRQLGTAVYESAKQHISKGLTDTEYLEMWKDIATILKHMSEMAKIVENRNILSALFKKSMPILKLFLSHGMPIIEMKFKTETDGIVEILKILQQSTRFFQSLCCHSKLKKDTTLMHKVPQMRQLLETLVYKVKAALAANKCTEAFWMGNLKNKNIRGEVIATQQSAASEEWSEDCDDQLPEDEEVDESDSEELINGGISDLV